MRSEKTKCLPFRTLRYLAHRTLVALCPLHSQINGGRGKILRLCGRQSGPSHYLPLKLGSVGRTYFQTIHRRLWRYFHLAINCRSITAAVPRLRFPRSLMPPRVVGWVGFFQSLRWLVQLRAYCGTTFTFNSINYFYLKIHVRRQPRQGIYA
ncbi:hypothetical protein BCR34DRAFT_386389 [Clohesyomyces aquaticus]|uniref:Uncharacterized protein n=1 Tax=Clohesyomyces aquaticus TaxID=1231657 RepID=A0A1Y1ZFD7_9PLEO|nr:hypothetical protein BCR34DRAFT_386389 [Clohesyomyces aquaticus]